MRGTLARGPFGRALNLLVSLATVWGICPTEGLAEEAVRVGLAGGAAVAQLRAPGQTPLPNCIARCQRIELHLPLAYNERRAS